METTSILLGLALFIAVLPFILEPFVRKGRRQRALNPARPDDDPAVAKEAALVAVRDLDFDFQTGKVTEADYQPLRQQLLLAAAEAAQRAERARPARPAARRPAGVRVDADIEAAVRSLRQTGQPGAGPRGAQSARACCACGTLVQASDQFCGHCGAALAVACPRCAAPVQADDRFCAGCGAALETKVEF